MTQAKKHVALPIDRQGDFLLPEQAGNKAALVCNLRELFSSID